MRTNESVILDDAAAQNPFSADPYIRQQQARSILCLPFLNQGQLIEGALPRNNLTPGVFAPARIAVLKLLVSQAAISLENARLYRDLAEREAKIRQLVEAQTPQAEDELRAIVDNAPVFLWSDLPDGHCDFLNQPWLNYFNLSLQEAQGAGWATVLHPDDAAHHLESWQKSVSTGIPFETEARFRRSDGEYRWFLTRANPLRDKTGRIVKWYGTNIDIENLKRTEAKLRQSEAYLAQAQRLSHSGWRPTARRRFSMGRRRFTASGGLIRRRVFASKSLSVPTDPPGRSGAVLAEVQRAVGEKEATRPGTESYYPMERPSTSK